MSKKEIFIAGLFGDSIGRFIKNDRGLGLLLGSCVVGLGFILCGGVGWFLWE
jgi:biotin transporter BioY